METRQAHPPSLGYPSSRIASVADHRVGELLLLGRKRCRCPENIHEVLNLNSVIGAQWKTNRCDTEAKRCVFVTEFICIGWHMLRQQQIGIAEGAGADEVGS
jgi:hypothetical protein